MVFLSRFRPSNLIILAALPFIIWLFATSPNYSRSLTAIVGVEPGSGAFVPGFLLILTVAMAGGMCGLTAGRMARVAAVGGFGALVILNVTDLALPFVASVMANAVDPFTSPLVIQGETPRRLTDAALTDVVGLWRWTAIAWGALFVPLMAGRLFAGARHARWAGRGLLVVNGAIAVLVLVVAHIGFATGLAISLRAAVLAYVLAILLGLLWVGLMQLRLHRRTLPLFAAITLALALAATWQFARPQAQYVLAGDLTGKVGIIKGTPENLISSIQFGAFPDATREDVPLRTLGTPEAAAAALADGIVSAALFPKAAAPGGAPVLWQTSALPDGNRVLGATFAVLAVALGLVAFAGVVHHRHPMSVAAEFIVDTIRGIPMLVIVLYIGLPLAGAVKDASGGFIDPPNLMRGIVAMALAYSAYLAEIFRAGINAVPTGQIEAARSLGLSRWQTARHVIVPQAFRIIIPPMGNEFIAILKDTSLLSILSIRDLTQRMREFQSASFLPFAPYNSAAIFYLLLTLMAASLIAAIERKHHVIRR